MKTPAAATLAVLVIALAGLPQPTAAEERPSFKIHVERPGVYRVAFEDLAAAAPALQSLPSADLGLTLGGEPVPVWIEDGGDGAFGPGDWLELVGEHLRGEVSYLDEHTRYNVYRLRSDGGTDPARMTAGTTLPATRQGEPRACSGRFHLEQDLLILRLRPRRDRSTQELWYWTKLTHVADEPFTLPVDLRDLDRGSQATVDLRVELRGWSEPKAEFKAHPEVADHRVEVALDGRLLESADWNGIQPYLLELPPIPAAALAAAEHSLEIRVPSRDQSRRGHPLIDVVMLNYVEIDFPRTASIRDDQPGQARCELAGGSEPGPLRLTSPADRELVVYGDSGTRIRLRPAARRRHDRVVSTFHPAAEDRSLTIAGRDQLLAPDAVVRDRPSRLADTENQADYLLIAHPRLLPAAAPLAELHRSRGLAVEVIDLEDVYDEFNHGIVHPRALRAFLEHAYHRWRRPAPRFVLLIGDASWDGRNALARDENYADWTYRNRESESFLKNESTPYENDAGLNHRGLIPTWKHATFQGHSASDNYFVAVDGDDILPDMAIGRWPVVEPEEVAAIVDKTVGYVSTPEVGPWRRKVLFIANEMPSYQRQSNRTAREISASGWSPLKIYPEKDEPNNEHHTRQLIERFDEGQLVVHFLGHGGRYIWRTGPPDLDKNHDLFTLDHLDQLAPNNRLPVVLSLTCYSAPFDHPNADSIGEKLLRVDGRGAVAVVGSSWRTGPRGLWGRVLLAELTLPGATIGEAVMRAKREIRDGDFVETYNLLGDPAVPLALPAAAVTLAADREAGGGLTVRGRVEIDDFAGQALVELVDPDGATIASAELELDGPEFTVGLHEPGGDLTAATIRVYAWNRDRGLDAAGVLILDGVAEPGGTATASP